jgi:hypothetical protein
LSIRKLLGFICDTDRNSFWLGKIQSHNQAIALDKDRQALILNSPNLISNRSRNSSCSQLRDHVKWRSDNSNFNVTKSNLKYISNYKSYTTKQSRNRVRWRSNNLTLNFTKSDLKYISKYDESYVAKQSRYHVRWIINKPTF